MKNSSLPTKRTNVWNMDKMTGRCKALMGLKDGSRSCGKGKAVGVERAWSSNREEIFNDTKLHLECLPITEASHHLTSHLTFIWVARKEGLANCWSLEWRGTMLTPSQSWNNRQAFYSSRVKGLWLKGACVVWILSPIPFGSALSLLVDLWKWALDHDQNDKIATTSSQNVFP